MWDKRVNCTVGIFSTEFQYTFCLVSRFSKYIILQIILFYNEEDA